MLGRYKPSQVELLVELHTIGCRDLYLPACYPSPVVPAFEIQPQAFHFATPGILRGVAASIASFRRSLAWLTFPEPVPHVSNRHGGHVPGPNPKPVGRHMEPIEGKRLLVEVTIRVRVNIWYGYHTDVRRDTLSCPIEVELCAERSLCTPKPASYWIRLAAT